MRRKIGFRPRSYSLTTRVASVRWSGGHTQRAACGVHTTCVAEQILLQQHGCLLLILLAVRVAARLKSTDRTFSVGASDDLVMAEWAGSVGRQFWREGGVMETLLQSGRSRRRLKAPIGSIKRRHGRGWWRAVLRDEALILAGRGRVPRPRRFGYVIHDMLTTRTFTASEHACRAYARAVIVRRVLARRAGPA